MLLMIGFTIVRKENKRLLNEERIEGRIETYIHYPFISSNRAHT